MDKKIEDEWREALAGVARVDIDDQREICITPFEGNYGKAGYVIAVNGSPPHGILIVIGRHDQPDGMTVIKDSWGTCKRIESPVMMYHLKHSVHRRLWEATKALLNAYLSTINTATEP